MLYSRPPHQPGLDERWFYQLQTIQQQLGETYINLEPTPGKLGRERERFEASGWRGLPDLQPDKIEADTIEMTLGQLHQLASELEANESNPYVRQAYLAVIEEMRLNALLVTSALHRNYDALDSYNTQLYEKPDASIFAAACDWICHDTQTTLEGSSGEVAELATHVLQLVPSVQGNRQLLVPDEATFQTVRLLHTAKDSFYDYVFGDDGLPVEPYIDQSRGDMICERLLHNIGSDFTIATSDNNIWAVQRNKRLLLRPAGYRIDGDEFIGIVSHEIGSHILEATNGARHPLRLLGVGLAGYEKGNEGRAFLREQIVYDHEATFLQQFAWEYIVLLHVSVSVTQGLDGAAYSFEKLYALVYALYRFWRERRSPLSTNNEAYAHEEAWYLAVRIFKGTTGTKGAYAKDAVYLEGNLKCWQLARTQPEMILLGDTGKFDINDTEHIAILRGLKIL